MTQSTKYLVFDNRAFTKVNETEYNRWHEEEWNKYEQPMFSKLIGGIIYTAQTFYHGNMTTGSKFKPFSIYYIEGNRHKVLYFRNWLSFKWQFEKLISKLQKKEIQHLKVIKLRPKSGSGFAVMASV